MTKPFRTDYKAGEQYLLGGSLLNAAAARYNEQRQRHVIDSRKYADVNAGVAIYDAPAIVNVMTIQRDDEYCDKDDLGNTVPPCPSEGLYLGYVKYWDKDSSRWRQYEEMMPLDAKCAGHRFHRGDVVPVYWDKLRGMFVPLDKAPPRRDLIPRYHGAFHTVVTSAAVIQQQGIAVVQSTNNFRNERDSYVELYVQIARGKGPAGVPADDTWQTIGRVSWWVPWFDTQRAWDETRAGFATFIAPHGTRLRFGVAGAWDPEVGDIHDQFNIGGLDWMTFGITPGAVESGQPTRNANGVYDHDAGLFTPDFDPLSIIKPFFRVTEVRGSDSKSPIWSHNDTGTIVQEYEEEDQVWLTGLYFEATLRSIRTVAQRTGTGTSARWMTRVECDPGGVLATNCYRDFGFPKEIGGRIDFQSSGNPEVCTDCTASECGICTWEWKDGSLEDPPSADFWTNNDPCRDTGPADCECDEPNRDGGFYGEIFETLCLQTGSSTSTPTTLSSSSISSLSSTSTRSSESSISASSSTQSLTTSSDSSTSSLGGG